MSTILDEVKAAATMLTSEERAQLAHFLIQSLDEGADADTQAAWLSLAKGRMAEVKAGKVVGVPAEEVLRSMPGSRP